MIKEFVELMNQSIEIHKKKNADYAAVGKEFENFDRSNHIAAWFRNPNDKTFVILIATKLARLATLLNSNREPNNESIEDSFLDLTTYCGLWAAYHKRHKADPLNHEHKFGTMGVCLICRMTVAEYEKINSIIGG